MAAALSWVHSLHQTRGETKSPKDGVLDEATKAANRAHNGVRARGEAGNAWLKVRFEALRHVSADPAKIGSIAAAALVLLHLAYDRTT